MRRLTRTPHTHTVTAQAAISALCALDRARFAQRLEGIFEHSSWIATRTWSARPFTDVGSLHAAMLETLAASSYDEKLALIRAHPELAGKEAETGTLTAASSGEQRGVGLDQCSREELVTLRRLNAEYRERHGFPFVIAVKGLTRYQIIDALSHRLNNDTAVEFDTCLHEIGKIARFRLDALFTDQPGG